MAEGVATVKIYRGLRDVYFDRSPCTYIDGRAGDLRYRGYSIHDLAEHSTFEEVSWLLLHGDLPTKSQLMEFDRALKSERELPAAIYDIIGMIKSAHPMDVLRTSVSALAAFAPEATDNSHAATLRKGVRLMSQVPVIIAAHARMRKDQVPVPPDRELGHAANFLWMLKAEKPSRDAAQLVDRDLVLHAEHGSNASSFTARVVTGTNANLHGAITAAVAALSGPAHGGAAEDVMKMAEEIGDPLRAADYVRERRKAGEPITGFGHRVYRVEDPRARHMRAGVERLSKEMGEPRWYQILQAVVRAMTPYARHGVNVNVDFYSGAVYYLLGIPRDLFVPVFAIGRVPGWVVQVLEQLDNNILIRPLTLYNGPAPRSYVPMLQRAE
ncbi:MAG: bifunctional 2-methylcitrate synthase/citrate synthase [Rhodospirillales bacterium]|nr:bifunctional 2-methylcitrate synthase/citrate synthase [Rhodospirillales bacterium]